MCETFYMYIAVYYVLFSHGALLLFVVYVEIAFKCGYTYCCLSSLDCLDILSINVVFLQYLHPTSYFESVMAALQSTMV